MVTLSRSSGSSGSYGRSLAVVALSLLGALSFACSRGGADAEVSRAPEPTAAPGSVEAAHEAYLAGDFVAVGERIRDVLLDPRAGQLAKDNVLELLDKAYEAQNGRMPSRFVLPSGVQGLHLAAMRGEVPHAAAYHTFFLYMRVRAGLADRVDEIVVQRLPDQPLLDRRGGRGALKVKHAVPGFDDLVLEAKGIDGSSLDGVLSVHVLFDGGPAIDTWVLARRMISSAAPIVESPAPSASFGDPNPVVRWTPFRSPEYAPFEERRIDFYVHDDAADRAAWDLWLPDAAELGTMTLGDHAGAPPTRLGPGSYWLALTASEERQFGPVILGRTSQTGVPFSVAR